MNDSKKMHVVMLPWLAFGHMVPFMELSIALAKQGVHVSFLSTPRNILRLPKIPPPLSQFLHFVPLPLPDSHRRLLPDSAEATVDMSADQIEHLKSACDALSPAVRAFVDATRPDWILVDFFYYWAADIAAEFKIPVMIYQVLCATTSLFFFLVGGGKQKKETLTEAQDADGLNSKVAFMEHEAHAMHDVFHGVNASRISDGERFGRLLGASAAIAIRTCNEFEGDAIKTYSEKSGKRILPVGNLPPPNPQIRTSAAAAEEPWASIFTWLDAQKPKSVIFVGFGSETKLTKEHIHEIALGLEQSELPFLWALRKPDEIELESDVLPAGFAGRTAGQGVVQMGWAPQRELLGHRSIGASFFHAGWGSIIEAMQFGHVLVFLPFIIDQPLNARMMVEKGLGIEVDRAKDGTFRREDVAAALKKAVVSGEAAELRARTEEAAKEVFTNYELHEKYVERFVEYLKSEGKN